MRGNTKKVIANIPGLEGYINNHYYGINGINSPIDKNLIPYAINSGIVFEANVADRLYELSQKTQSEDCEYSFILLGNIVINKNGGVSNGVHIVGFFEHNMNIQSRVATFDNEMLKYINYVTEGKSKFNTLFICHTHPAKGNYYMNFSLGDLDGTVALHEDNPQFKIDNYGQGILTGDGQVFFVFYDPKTVKVYQFKKYIVNLPGFPNLSNYFKNKKQENTVAPINSSFKK